MITKSNLTIRYIPLLLYLIILYIFMFISNTTGDLFDFWITMINFPEDLTNWLIAGVYVVLFSVLLAVIRLQIIKYSFQGLNENIPQTDLWESIQFMLLVSSVLVPIIIGLLYSFDQISAIFYQWFLAIWIIINFLPDFSYYFYWMSKE